MEQGGNAIDAAAAMCFCLNLLEPQSNGIGGEAPTLIDVAKEKKTFAISGMGCRLCDRGCDDNRRALGVAARDIQNLELGHAHVGDTTHLDALDREGNMVAATPSVLGFLADL